MYRSRTSVRTSRDELWAEFHPRFWHICATDMRSKLRLYFSHIFKLMALMEINGQSNYSNTV
uniref:Uncharacterized protein n=1 Tax=Arion vulgaris TaxID=1028688 RepID=A0A0B6ZLE2_9EUPU